MNRTRTCGFLLNFVFSKTEGTWNICQEFIQGLFVVIHRSGLLYFFKTPRYTVAFIIKGKQTPFKNWL